MPAYTTDTAGATLKEVFDPVLGEAISKRRSFYAYMRKKIEKKDINDRGYRWTLKTGRNQGYGSHTSAQEGGLLPRSGALTRKKMQADYRDHFISGELTGRVIAEATNKTSLVNASKDAMQDAVESFDTFQDFYMFGNGSGSRGVVTTGYSGGSPTLLTFALAQATPYGSMMIEIGQRIHFHHPTTFVKLEGGAVTVSTVTAKDTATDIVTFDAVPTDCIAGSIAVIEDTINREVRGLDFHVGNAGTSWWNEADGSAITRSAAPYANANVIDKSGAALDPDFLDTIALQTANQTGDGTPNWDQVLVSHPCQQNQYRKLGRTLTTMNASSTGNKKLDLGFANVSHNGMEWRTSSHCQADRIYGLSLNDWVMPETKAPHMKEFAGGNTLVQKPGTDRYYDAQQFAVEARYELVCKRPFTQFLLKNLAFNTSDVRRVL